MNEGDKYHQQNCVKEHWCCWLLQKEDLLSSKHPFTERYVAIAVSGSTGRNEMIISKTSSSIGTVTAPP